jgi:hypothetical protein
MILSFKTLFPWGTPTNFIEKITRQPGFTPKIHTIRKGKRWKPGNKIHFATGVRTKNYKQFNFGMCISTQHIAILKNPKGFITVIIDYSRILDDEQKQKLATNDGFDSIEDFYKWFEAKGFTGQIIHWTTFKY